MVIYNSSSQSPVIQQRNLAGPTYSSFSNYHIGQFSSNFELRPTLSSAPILSAHSNLVSFNPDIYCSSSLEVAHALTVSHANITTAELSSLQTAQATVRGDPLASPSVEHFRVDLGESFPLFAISKEQGFFQTNIGDFKLGIGTTAPEQQLHIDRDAIVNGTLYNNTSIVTPKIVSQANPLHSIEFLPDCNVITGRTLITGNVLVEGSFKSTARQDFDNVQVFSNLDVAHIYISNIEPQHYSAIRIDNVIPTYSYLVDNSNVVTACNVEPIIDIDVHIPALDVSYRALTMDSYGRIGMGTHLPQHYLSLEASSYNKQHIGKGLIFAKSSLNEEDPDCNDVFVVDHLARVGVGTAAPLHHLHVDVCSQQTYSNAIIGLHKSHEHACSFLEFSCNAVPVTVLDRNGTLFIGSGMSNLVIGSNNYHNVMCAIKNDTLVSGSVITSGIASSEPTNIINAHMSHFSNMASLESSNISSSNIASINVATSNLSALNISIPGLSITGDTFSTNLDKFGFFGKAAIFSPDMNSLSNFASLTTTNIYTNESQGKVQIIAPLSQFTNIQNVSQTYMLKLEAPSPIMVLRNTRNQLNDGDISSSKLVFAYDKTATTTLRGTMRFMDGRFYFEHDSIPVFASQRDHFHVLQGAFGVYDNTTQGLPQARVSYFNFLNEVDSDIRDSLAILKGVQINGDLYIQSSTTATPHKLTVRGDAEVSGVATLSNLAVTGTASLASATVTGTLTAGVFSGDGSLLTNLNISSENIGNLPTSVTGTQNQIIASSPTGPIQLSLPQDIHTDAAVQFGSLGVGTPPGPSGEIRSFGDIIGFYSDARLKTNIEEIPDALEKLQKLRGVYYTQNDFAETFGYSNYSRQVGLIAQEVSEVLPEVVRTAPFDMNADGSSASGQNYLTLQYERLIPLLVQAIKEQNERFRIPKGISVSQQNSKNNEVVCNSLSGTITLYEGSFMPNELATFKLNNTSICEDDQIVTTQIGPYSCQAAYFSQAVASNGFAIVYVRNITTEMTPPESPIIKFTVIRQR